MPPDVVEQVEGGRVHVRTPPNPRTGLADKILDPLDLLHALNSRSTTSVNTWSAIAAGTRAARGGLAPVPGRP